MSGADSGHSDFGLNIPPEDLTQWPGRGAFKRYKPGSLGITNAMKTTSPNDVHTNFDRPLRLVRSRRAVLIMETVLSTSEKKKQLEWESVTIFFFVHFLVFWLGLFFKCMLNSAPLNQIAGLLQKHLQPSLLWRWFYIRQTQLQEWTNGWCLKYLEYSCCIH